MGTLRIGILILGGLLMFPAVSHDKIKFWEKKQESFKTVVVLCDLSGSTEKVRGIYLEAIKTILPSIQHGDALLVAKITDKSITEPVIPVKLVLPKFEARDRMGNPTDNKFLVDSAKKEADQTLAVKKEEAVKTFVDLIAPVEKKGSKNPARINRTDILSSLHLADKLFKDYHREKAVLVLFSDMIEDSADYNFEKEHLTGKRIGQIVQKEKGRNRLPDLKNAKVFIVAAGAPSSQKFFDIQNFWLAYFKECGADLSKENYGSTLVKFEE